MLVLVWLRPVRNNGCNFLILVMLLCNHCGCGADDEALRLLLKGNELVGQDPPRHLEAIEAWRSFALCNVAFSSASAISHLTVQKLPARLNFASFHTHQQARYLKKCSRERPPCLHKKQSSSVTSPRLHRAVEQHGQLLPCARSNR